MIQFFNLSARAEWEWIASRAQCVYSEDMKGIVAYRGNEIVGAVALDNWSYNSVNIHIAIEDPLIIKHRFLHQVANYVFVVADRGILVGITPADNEKALRFNRKIGFEVVYRMKDGYKKGVDFVVQELRKENCRYLDGQEVNTRAA